MSGWRAVLAWALAVTPVAALQVLRRILARAAFAAGQGIMEVSWWIDPDPIPMPGGGQTREPTITGCPCCGAVSGAWAGWTDEEGDVK